MSELIARSERDNSKELEYVHGKLYFQILELLDGGQDASKIEELLNSVPDQFRDRYRRFVASFREVFKRHTDSVAEILKNHNLDSVADLVAGILIDDPNICIDQTLTLEQKQAIAEEFKRTVVLRTTLPGVYQFILPADLFCKIRGKEKKGGAYYYREGNQRIYYMLISAEADEKINKGIRSHEVQHIIWQARDEVVQRKHGDFNEFIGEPAQKQISSVFLNFQDEVIAYLIMQVFAERDCFTNRLYLSDLIYEAASDFALATTIDKYLVAIKSYLHFDRKLYASYEDLKVFLYPLMAASDFKDMMRRLKATKEKYFKRKKFWLFPR